MPYKASEAFHGREKKEKRTREKWMEEAAQSKLNNNRSKKYTKIQENSAVGRSSIITLI